MHAHAVGKDARVHVVLADGEPREGSTWGAAQMTTHLLAVGLVYLLA